MINEAINKLAEKQNLTGAETIGAFGEIMNFLSNQIAFATKKKRK